MLLFHNSRKTLSFPYFEVWNEVYNLSKDNKVVYLESESKNHIKFYLTSFLERLQFFWCVCVIL